MAGFEHQLVIPQWNLRLRVMIYRKHVQHRFGADAESSFLVEPEPGSPGRGRTYYSLADQLALEISYGLPGPGEHPLDHEAFSMAIDLHAALSAFLESAVVAYCRLRDIPPEAFKRREA